jgi:uncharacterized protein YlxP (DUF503 family)
MFVCVYYCTPKKEENLSIKKTSQSRDNDSHRSRSASIATVSQSNSPKRRNTSKGDFIANKKDNENVLREMQEFDTY